MMAMGIMMGGHVRVGLEDNIYSQRGVLTTNVQLVEKAVRLAHEFEREIATPDEARAMLGLKGWMQFISSVYPYISIHQV